jgi:glutathione S-transferase
MALHEKNISFEVIEEDLKNFSDSLKKLHPEAKVPLLVHGDLVVYESAIITEYVNDLPSSENSLMPNTGSERALVRLWTYWCNTVFKPDLDRYKYGTARFKMEDCQGVEERLVGHLSKLEAQLLKTSFLVGSTFTLADVHIFPFVRQLSRVQPSPLFLDQFTRLLQWRDEIQTRPSFVLTLQK